MRTLIIMLAALLMLGCSAKKTNSLKSESEGKTDLIVTDNKLSVIESNKIETSEGEECTEIYEPADPEKPMVIDDGKGNTTTIYNGKKSITKTKSKSQANTQVKETVTATAVTEIKHQAKATVNAKEMERQETGSKFYTAGGIVIGLAIVVWFIWFFVLPKKYTNENKN